ncbi:DUF1553 domain-containing protein [Rubripirellula reticaptiva]|uniref:Planctomycete cytochrome C n=1 Tax=Rubripirellula reticaptiva TaxID=2528013 RepID=A0A5C6EKR6_9BACT|nr:DUF1553 domain-containing protein [Rubripirellula reticaptiva]TWU48161.1 Planctomycete cytochrome C [Rubripirellula reticaptiva]
MSSNTIKRLIVAASLAFGLAFASVDHLRADESGADISQPDVSHPNLVADWDFEAKPDVGVIVGKVQRDRIGPRPPRYPDTAADNLAFEFGGQGARIVVPDLGESSRWDFANGDVISIEAILKVDDIAEGENSYIVGKGRTFDKGFERDNQNWALRICKRNGQVRVGFLFATPKDGSNSVWHRWISHDGWQSSSSAWHHIAVSYRFGKPDSMRAWIDGRSTDGQWDMGGPTQTAPVVDDAAVWIGSSMAGQNSSSLRGQLDRLIIYRRALTDSEMALRWNPLPPPPPSPPTMTIPAGQVTWWFDDQVPSHTAWQDADWQAKRIDRGTWLNIDAPMLLNRLPHAYDDHGVRDAYRDAVWLRLGADVDLPAGTHRFVVRSRGLSRLWIDDQRFDTTGPLSSRTDGHNPVEPLPERPAAKMRRVAYGVEEKIVEHTIKTDGIQRVILETLIGGKSLRAEPGETVVAVQLNSTGPFLLLRPAPASLVEMPMTDGNVTKQLKYVEKYVADFETDSRHQLAASQNAYWDQRHFLAREHLQTLDPIDIPSSDASSSVVDKFILAKIEKHRSTATSNNSIGEPDYSAADHFTTNVLPILKQNCFRCHDEDDEGGLRLSSAADVAAGGDSGELIVRAGDPHGSELMRRIRSPDESERMPPSEPMSSENIETLDEWIASGATWGRSKSADEIVIADLVDDETFLRRAYLDTVGLPPTRDEYFAFMSSGSVSKRADLIDQLLTRTEVADHWVSFWQDILAENPNLLKPSLNNTGPFRYFLYEALIDNQPVDRMVTELLMLRGSLYQGGSAGFGMAADNDAPEATRSIVAASAFLGINLQCARCHDSPYHETTQHDLFSLAAMLARKDVKVPASSTVPAAFFEDHGGRDSLIEVTLQPGVPVQPEWPFAELVSPKEIDRWSSKSADSRERFAAAITSPANSRFAAVIVNRVWKRLIGTGFVEPVGDWESAKPSHPELLRWLSHDFIRHGYDLRLLAATIMKSDVYQRQAGGSNLDARADERWFAAPDRRRLSAEQLVDSMVAASGRPLDVEELSFDPEARRPAKTMLQFGSPSRAWQFTTLSNERDRPSLALPRASAVVDVMKAFGWTGNRQSAIDSRDNSTNVLQPGAIGNSVFASWTVAASMNSDLANLAINADSSRALVESLYIRFLSRRPTDNELHIMVEVLQDGFDDRLVPGDQVVAPERLPGLEHVSWSNHLAGPANTIKIEMERRAIVGDAPDPRLRTSWRTVYEDVVWSILNSPEFVWLP